ncbi:MAG: hypothetical protein VX589_10145, partial [Myxococcota bacterium]|nr:hypothetical protein [Myxococcota bacterium]
MKRVLFAVTCLLWFAVGCSSESEQEDLSLGGANSMGELAGRSSGGVDESVEQNGDTPSSRSNMMADNGGDAPGCYDLSVHQCDCSVSESECAGGMKIWTPNCNCPGDNAGPTDGSGQSTNGGMSMGRPPMSEGVPGCYSGPPDHMCDCETDEDTCKDSGGLWTPTCDCMPVDEGAGGDAGSNQSSSAMSTPPDAGGDDAQSGQNQVEGCYSGPPSHMCDCETTEAECQGIWTDRCRCNGENPVGGGSHAGPHEAGGGADAGGGANVGGGQGDNSGDGGASDSDAPEGCYSGPPTHMCDCETTEAECQGIWTDRCRCNGENPVGGSSHAGHQEAGGDADTGGGVNVGGGQGDDSGDGGASASDAPEGCYSGPPSHMCDCDTTEADCQGIWSDRCQCHDGGPRGGHMGGGPHGAGHHAGGHDAVGGTQESSGGQADNPSEIGPGRPGTAEGCYAGPP